MSVSRRTIAVALATLLSCTGAAWAQAPAACNTCNDRAADSRLMDRTAIRLAAFAQAGPGSRFEDDSAAPVVPEPSMRPATPARTISAPAGDTPAPAAPAKLPAVSEPAPIKANTIVKEKRSEEPAAPAIQPLPKAAVPATVKPLPKSLPKAPTAELTAPPAPYVDPERPQAKSAAPAADLPTTVQAPPAPAAALAADTAPPMATEGYACPSRCCHRSCDEPLFALPQPACFQESGIVLGGWLDQGITYNANRSQDGYNGVVTFNDRNGEWMINQVNMFLAKEAKSECGSLDLGGRIDVLSGTDARFTQATGLETDWNQVEHYQLALPQFYGELAYNDWKLRAGHFYAPVGYEVVPAPDNFFYSHSYTFQYGEPFTLTGVQVTRNVTDRFSINAGVHRGWDRFRDLDGADSPNFIAGFNWKSCSERVSLAFEVSTGELGVDNNTVFYSLVGQVKVTDRLTWVVQHDYGQSTGGLPQNQLPQVLNTAEWYGLNQYWLYEINCKWSGGIRFEWFRDNNGTRVHGLGRNNLVGAEDFMGNFYELTAGLNWKPRKGVLFRPEIRYDWYSGDVPGLPLPYPPTSVVNTPAGQTSSGTRSDQFLAAFDLILTF